MNIFKHITDNIVENLGLSLNKKEVAVVHEFSSDRVVTPINSPMIVVGYLSVKVEPNKTRFSGEDSRGYYFLQNISMEIYIDILVPYSLKGVYCQELLFDVMNYFTLDKSEYKVNFIKSKEVEDYKKLSAYNLRCMVGIDASTNVFEENNTEIKEINVVRRDFIV